MKVPDKFRLMRRYLSGWTPRPQTLEGDAFEVEIAAALVEMDRLRAALWRCAMTAEGSSIDDPSWSLPNNIIFTAKGALRGWRPPVPCTETPS